MAPIAPLSIGRKNMRANLLFPVLLAISGTTAGFFVGRHRMLASTDAHPHADDGSRSRGNSAAPSELPESDQSQPSLVGRWFYTVCLSGNVPTGIYFVQIEEDGGYDELELSPIPDTVPTGSEGHWLPVGMELLSHIRGGIDLATGDEQMEAQNPRSLAVSVNWTVRNGILWRYTDTGNAGDFVSFTRELH